MFIGGRIRAVREVKNLSQGDMEKRTGLACSYLSRVEHGRTVPGVDTLEKIARGLELPLYELLYDGGKTATFSWGRLGADGRLLSQFRRCLSHMNEHDQGLLFAMADSLSKRTKRRRSHSAKKRARFR